MEIDPLIPQHNMQAQSRRRLIFYNILYFSWHVPQVFAVVYVLWRFADQSACDKPLAVWAAVYALRLASLLVLRLAALIDYRGTYHLGESSTRFQRSTEVFAFMWFVMGNVWVFQSRTCAANAPQVYLLCATLLFANYFIVCCPLLLVLLILPIICCISPTTARRALATMEPNRHIGLTEPQLQALPTVVYSERLLHGASQDPTCSICLEDFQQGEELRLLHETHYFHKQCLDPWLSGNSTCPVCRTDIVAPARDRGVL